MKLEDQLDSAASEIDDELSKLEARRNWLTNAREEWEVRSESEKEAFRRSAQPIAQQLETSQSFNEFISLLEDLEEAYQKPVLDALKAQIQEFIEELDIDVSERELDKIHERLEDRFEEELLSARETYSALEEELNAAPDPVKELVKHELNDDPLRLLTPEDTVKSRIDKYTKRFEDLENITSFSKKQTWFPDSILPFESDLERYSEDVASESILENINDIGILLDDFAGLDINLAQVTANQIETRIENETLESLFNEVVQEVSEIEANTDLLATIEAIETDVEYDSPAIDRIRSSAESVRKEEYTTFEAIKEDLSSLRTALARWESELKEDWAEQRTIIRSYSNNFEFELDEEIAEAMENGAPIEEDPLQTYDLIVRSRKWIDAREEDLKDELKHEESLLLLRKLVNTGQVSFDSFKTEHVEEVHSILPLEISIDEE